MNTKGHHSLFEDAATVQYIILGSGGGGRTAASIIEAQLFEQSQILPKVAFLDDSEKRLLVNGYPVIGPTSRALDNSDWSEETGFVVAFGSMHLIAREHIFRLLQDKGRRVINIVHPRASIDRCASLGVGNVITANCVLHPNSRLGNNCFLCLAVTIDHDNEIGDNIYFSPGVHLAGGVIIENNVFLGTGAAVLPGVHIGKGAIIGAGAVVTKDVEAGATVVGVPARPIKIKKEIQS